MLTNQASCFLLPNASDAILPSKLMNSSELNMCFIVFNTHWPNQYRLAENKPSTVQSKFVQRRQPYLQKQYLKAFIKLMEL